MKATKINNQWTHFLSRQTLNEVNFSLNLEFIVTFGASNET